MATVKLNIGLRVDVKKLFFDRAAVMKHIAADKRRYYAKAGAYARRTARNSIKPNGKQKDPRYPAHPKGPEQDLKVLRGAASRPGQPPRNRTGRLRGGIFFAYDRPNDDVIVGPVGFSKGSKIPAILEYGGRTTRIIRSFGQPISRTMMTIAPRPYMQPALQKTIPHLPKLYAEAVRSM